MGPALAPVPSLKSSAENRRCPKCGSSQVTHSRRRHVGDWLMFPLALDPYRCTQCLRRFFRFRSPTARRALTITLCLLPVAILTVWFLELYSLDRFQYRAAPEQPKAPETLARPTVDDILKKR